MPVHRLYVGRAFSEALAVTRRLEAELFVVSAGLGLVHERDDAPNYDASVAEGEGSLKFMLQSAKAKSWEWWNALASLKAPNGFLHEVLRDKRPEVALIALPAAYVELLSDDIARIPNDYIQQVRIFTSPAGAARVPMSLKTVVMPYDDRLEGSSRPGTRTDFPQRAMRHFVEELDAVSLSLEQASSRVKASLARLKRREVPTRQRKSDEEVMKLLSSNWDRYQGSSSRLLRFLRDEALVACEQSRFRNLWLQLRPEMNGQKTVHA